MSLPLLAPVASLTALGVPEDQARRALERASARFRAAVGHPVTRVTRTIVLDPPCGETLPLPGRDIRDVSVTLGGAKADGVEISPRTGVLRRRAGWGRSLGGIQVTFTSGSEEVPEDVADAVLEHATMLAATARTPGVSQISQGSRSVSYSVTSATGVTQRWTDAVDRWAIHRQAGF